jgi:hypothetical protein
MARLTLRDDVNLSASRVPDFSQLVRPTFDRLSRFLHTRSRVPCRSLLTSKVRFTYL